jgi:hypothetical protein
MIMDSDSLQWIFDKEVRSALLEGIGVSSRRVIIRLAPDVTLQDFKNRVTAFNQKTDDKIITMRDASGVTKYRWNGDRRAHIPRGLIDAPPESGSAVRVCASGRQAGRLRQAGSMDVSMTNYVGSDSIQDRLRVLGLGQ